MTMLLGKPRYGFMAGTICRFAGTENHNVIVGPRIGVDVSVLRIGDGRVLISSCDPISLIPTIGPEKSAALSVHAVASDIATSGIAPRFATFNLNLPPSMSDGILREYWHSVHRTCRKLGISILGGHTGRFKGCDYSVIGGATMFAIGDENRYVSSGMARDGDSLIETKSAALESAAMLSMSFPRTVEKKLGSHLASRAESLWSKISTVKDALIAASAGLGERGVTAMHDVTEGGIISAVLDMAHASGLSATLDSESIPIYDEVREICSMFRIDPLKSLGQGSLLISSRPKHVNRLIDTLKRRQIDASVIGTLKRVGKNTIASEDGGAMVLSYPKEDPYWKAYWHGVNRHLR